MNRTTSCQSAAFGLALALFANEAAAAGGTDWERDFRTPPAAFKSMPLWHLNGKLTTQGITDQLQDSRDKSGFSGVAVLPVKETEPAYLTDEYFARYGDILETSKRLGMKVVFYDDIGFPSGSAGGRMRTRFPDDMACRLDKAETNVVGPQAWSQTLPKGIFMGAVAMHAQTGERRDLSAAARDGRIDWKIPAGQWTLMVFTCVRSGGHVDYLCPESVDKFISLTYDEYYKRFAPYFGPTLSMTFFDDVGVRGEERRTWTPAFNVKFERKYGYSPVALYPALWHDIGPDTESARAALFGFRAELLAEGYPRKVHEWAAAHGILSSGHAMGQYHPQPAFLAGDAITFYRHSDVPMIDSIHYYGHGRPGFKLTSSAAYSYDRPLTAVEIYGNYKTFDATMLYRSGMELFARGANVFLPHGMWYDPQAVRIKPLISHFDPKIGPALPAYNDWVGRTCLLLQGGRHVADIGVLYPVASMLAHARLDAVVDQRNKPGNTHPGLYVPPQTDVSELSDCLTGELRRDFTFLHPEILNDRCAVDGPALHLNNVTNYEDYRVLILPAGRVIYASNLKKIRAFCDAGGKVIATSLLPCKSAEPGRDQEVVAAVRDLFGVDPAKAAAKAPYSKRANAAGGAAYFVPALAGLGAALDDALPVADVRFAEPGPAVEADKGMLSYIHKVKNGRQLYFFANSSDAPADLTVTLRGHLSLQNWNPHDGSMRPVQATSATESGQEVTRFTLRLEPVSSTFIVETGPGLSGSAPEGPKPGQVLRLWPGDAPGRVPSANQETLVNERFRNVSVPELWCYFPSSPGKKRAALIICPGGGYGHLAMGVHVGPVVGLLNSQGVAVFGLKYRTRYGTNNVADDAAADCARAVRLVRLHADEWGIDPARIGVQGYSAGANVGLNLLGRSDAGNPQAADPAERLASRPDFMALMSPWPNGKAIASYPVLPNPPPVFIASARDDTTAPTAFALEIAEAVKRQGGEVRLFIVPDGGHGAFHYGAGSGPGMNWPEEFLPMIPR